MSKSTPSGSKRKNPDNRPADFPLSIHKASGLYCKKVRGKVRYYGKVIDDPTGVAARAMWEAEKEDLLAGREPKPKAADANSLMLFDLCDRFITHKEKMRDLGELSPRSYADYFGTCAEVVAALGRTRLVLDLTPADFRHLKEKLKSPGGKDKAGKKRKPRGSVALACHMQRAKSLFKFAYDEGLIEHPIRYGQGFNKPPQHKIDAEKEAHKAEHGDLMFEAAEIRQMLHHLKDSPGMRAMVLLAANCGFGQSDLSRLTRQAINLETGWCVFGRQKTGVARRIPLWPETSAAVRAWLPVRPAAKAEEDDKLLFLTCRGVPFVRVNAKGRHIDSLGVQFGKMTTALKLSRSRRGIYALRHSFETIAGELGDQVAVDAVMGHKDRSMASHYRERIGDDRLVRVVEHVRKWVFAEPETEPDGDKNLDTRFCVPSELANPTHDSVGEIGTQDSTQNRRQYASSESTQKNRPALRIFREEIA